MSILSLTPNIMVSDVGKTIEFYKDLLGFELIHSVPGEDSIDWAMMQSGPAMIMFQSQKSMASEVPAFGRHSPGTSYSLFIKVDKIKDFHNRIKDKVNVVKDLHQTFYGATEFTFSDPDGIILTFAEMADD